jgi:iron complex transport system ATP-binding protein
VELKAQGAAFSYARSASAAPIFKNVSFTVESSEAMCILGPNGAGKSTLLRCLAGLLALGGGRITYDGRNVLGFSRRALAKIMAYLPQDHSPAFPFSAVDVVTMGRTAHIGHLASPGAKELSIALQKMEFLRISHLAEKRYTNLSGGERQLVMLAAALAQEPVFLLLDEPTSHLDFGNQHRFLKLLKNLKERGIGVVMTSHFPDHALAASDRVIVLKDGSVASEGTPEEVITGAEMSALYEMPVEILDTKYGKRCIADDGRHGAPR